MDYQRATVARYESSSDSLATSPRTTKAMNELERQLLTLAIIGLPIILALTWVIGYVDMVTLSNSIWQAGKMSHKYEGILK